MKAFEVLLGMCIATYPLVISRLKISVFKYGKLQCRGRYCNFRNYNSKKGSVEGILRFLVSWTTFNPYKLALNFFSGFVITSSKFIATYAEFTSDAQMHSRVCQFKNMLYCRSEQ